jgi:acyl-CoA synthetase (AMP-forming)/AMP-acid ligase II
MILNERKLFMSVELNLSKQLVLGEIPARWARKTPDREAFVFNENRLTFAQFNRRVNRLANALIDLGIDKDDKVSVLFMNCIEILECYMALSKIGAVVVPINFRLVAPEISYQLEQSDTTAVIYGEMFHEVINALRDRHPKIRRYICLSEMKIEGTIHYETLLEEGSPGEPLVYVDDDDPAFIMYTSGTTGKPKGAVLTHKNLIAEITNIVLENGMQKGDRSIFSAPLYHIAALIHTLSIFFLGGFSVIMDKFETRELLRLIEKERPQVAQLIPSMWIFLLEEPSLSEYDTSSLRNVGTGGAILPVEVNKKAKKLFPKVAIFNIFGQTETSAGTTIQIPEHALTKEGSVGRRLSCIEARIVDDDDKDLPVGRVGEIVYRGPTVMKGYYKNPEATARAMRGGWFHSGDLVREDEDGFIYVVDRKDDMIISGGENIYPAEVEGVLFTHPGILEAAVIGVPDPQWGKNIKALVVPKKGETLTEKEIIDYCKQHLASYKKPKSVEFLKTLPRNASGKVLKTTLWEKYANNH